MQDEGYESPKPSYSPPQQSSQTPASQSYEYGQPPKKRSPKKLLLLIGGVLLVLVLFNGLRMLGQRNQPSPTPTPTPSIEDFSALEPTPTPSEEPTPAPTVDPVDPATGLDRSELSVRIENGSGTAGAAGKASTYLKGLGYNVVSTGNASNFDYEDVTIQIKSSEKAFLPLLNKDLSKEYSVGSATSDLSATASAEAIVIIGR